MKIDEVFLKTEVLGKPRITKKSIELFLKNGKMLRVLQDLFNNQPGW
jgi:hypothetical protein